MQKATAGTKRLFSFITLISLIGYYNSIPKGT
jgi:hypothetical protein